MTNHDLAALNAMTPSDFVAAIGDPFRPTNARGLYRTRDGGASWQRVLFVSDSTGAVDVEFHPTNPQIVYAAMWRGERKPWTIISGAREGGIYKSTDGGSTWTQLSAGVAIAANGTGSFNWTVTSPATATARVRVTWTGNANRTDASDVNFIIQ